MAKNNEAKIKFTGDTKELNSQIKSANSTLAALRAGLKLNEAEFKNTGDTVEYFKTKQNLLQKELEENRKKQEALNQKLELAKSVFGENSTEVQELSTKLNRAKTEEQSLITQVSQCENEMQQQAAAAQKEQTALEQLNTEISEQKSKLEALKTEYKNIVLEQGSSSDEAQELKSKINQLNSELEQNEQKLSDIDNEFKEVDNAAEKAGQSVEKSSDGYTVLKDVVADLASEALDSVKEKFKEVAIEGERTLDMLKAKTGASSEEMQKYENVAKSVYQNAFGESLNDVTQVISTIIEMTGELDDASLQNITQNAMTLNDVYDMDIKESMRAVNSLVNQFGISYDEAFNLIVQGTQKGLNQNEDFLDTINEYSVQYKNAGLSANEMFNMLVNGAEMGTWSIDKLGDAFKEYNIRMSDGSANDALKDLGLNAEKLTAEYAKGGDSAKLATQKIITALENTKDKQKQYVDGQAIMGTMWEDLGADAVFALMNTQGEIDMTKSSMESLSNDAYDNLGTAFQGIGATIETDLLMPLAEEVTPFVTSNVLPMIQDIISEMKTAFNWMQEHKTMLGIIAGVIAIVTTAMILQSAAQAATSAIQTAKTTANLAETASLWSLVAAQTAALAPYIAIVAAIAAVIAIIVVCVKHWDEIKAKVTEVTDNMKNKVTDMKENVSGKFEELKGNATAAIDGVKDKFNAGVDFFKNDWKELLLLIVNPFAGAFALLYKHNDNFRAKVDELKNKVVGSFTSMTDKVKSLFGGMKLSFPDIKMPHFKVTPSGWKIGDLLEGSIPKLGIEWYAKGAVFKKPTVLNSANGLKGVGEAGAEAIAPIKVLQSYVQDSVDASLASYMWIDYDLLGAKVALACAKMNIIINYDNREFGRAVRSVV